MLKKTYLEKQGVCMVTFNVKFEGASKVELVGEWNNWIPEVMKRKKDGSFWITKRLKKGREYRFRYLIDGHLWENDSQADRYVPNPYGSMDSVVIC
jgi:1,4-alpha-glucan branching enzyme